MSKSKFENTWQIMKKYDFNKDDKFETDLLCVICQKLLINAYISPCLCRFCFDCISSYLNEERKPCPGNTDDCKIVLISLKENIAVDHVVNNTILKVFVKCPENLCEFKDELRNMEKHIRNCKYRSVCCPYLNIGCNLSNIGAGNVIDHLQSEIERHTKLLMDCIDNFNYEIGRLKVIVDKLGVENSMLKSEINEMNLDRKKKQDVIEELQNEMKEKSVEIDILNKQMQKIEMAFEIEIKSIKSTIEIEFGKLKLNAEIKEKALVESQVKRDKQTCKIDLINDEIRILKNADKCMREDVDELKLDREKNKKLIITLKNKYEQQDEQFEQISNKYQQIEKKFVNAKQERENKEKDLMRSIDEMRNKRTEMTTMSNTIDEAMKNVENKLWELEICQTKKKYGEFVWRIDKINDKINDAKNGINPTLFSDSFYTHKRGYKMCIRVDPGGYDIGMGTHLSVYFSLMKGNFDDILEWPFVYDVTLSLINQQTRLPHVSMPVQFIFGLFSPAYMKPIAEISVARGFPKFIELNELSTNANLMLNNQIFIKCTVNIR